MFFSSIVSVDPTTFQQITEADGKLAVNTSN